MTAKTKWGFELRDVVVFDLILLLIFGVFAVTSLQYNPRARSIPLAMGIIGAAMMALQLLADAVPRARAHLRFVGERGLLGRASPPGPGASTAPAEPAVGDEAEAEDSEEMPPLTRPEASWWAVFRLVLWLFGFVALLAWTNYLVAVALFTILVTRLEAGAKWWQAIVLAAGVDLSFYLLFQVILGAQI